jgi:hypothetical protein
MATLKPTSETGSSPKSNTGRRSFIWKTGAAMSAMVASAVAGISKSGADQSTGLQDQIDRLSAQVGILEDANAIRKLHQSYETYLDQGMYEEVVSLFADDGQVYFNGGIFSGKDKGIRRLFQCHFAEGLTGKKIELEPAPGCQLVAAQQPEEIEVATDRQSAKAFFWFSMRAGTPMDSESTLVQMARLQGQGIVHWWEGGICENSYVKVGNVWKIKRIGYRTIVQANPASSWAYAKPISVPLFSKAYPEHPTGPDKLVAPELRA